MLVSVAKPGPRSGFARRRGGVRRPRPAGQGATRPYVPLPLRVGAVRLPLRGMLAAVRLQTPPGHVPIHPARSRLRQATMCHCSIKRVIRVLAKGTDFWRDTVWITESTAIPRGMSRPAVKRSELAARAQQTRLHLPRHVDLFAALNTATDKVITVLFPQHRALDFRNSLDEIDKRMAAHIICDSLSAHKRPWCTSGPSRSPASSSTSPLPTPPGPTRSSGGAPILKEVAWNAECSAPSTTSRPHSRAGSRSGTTMPSRSSGPGPLARSSTVSAATVHPTYLRTRSPGVVSRWSRGMRADLRSPRQFSSGGLLPDRCFRFAY